MIDTKKTAPIAVGKSGQSNFVHKHSSTPFFISIAQHTEYNIYVCLIKSENRICRQYARSPYDALNEVIRLYGAKCTDIHINYAYAPLNT